MLSVGLEKSVVLVLTYIKWCFDMMNDPLLKVYDSGRSMPKGGTNAGENGSKCRAGSLSERRRRHVITSVAPTLLSMPRKGQPTCRDLVSDTELSFSIEQHFVLQPILYKAPSVLIHHSLKDFCFLSAFDTLQYALPCHSVHQ